MKWEIIERGAKSAEENMAFDEELFQNLSHTPILHLYEWERPSITYGYFAQAEKLLRLEECKARGIDLARRPTGGGVVFHIWDLAFSLLLPSSFPGYPETPLQGYQFVHRLLAPILEKFAARPLPLELIPTQEASDGVKDHFCMAHPTRYDLVVEGKKVAGAAQRRKRHGFLHQGTIALQMPPREELERLLPKGSPITDAVLETTFPLLPGGDLQKGRRALRELLRVHIPQIR